MPKKSGYRKRYRRRTGVNQNMTKIPFKELLSLTFTASSTRQNSDISALNFTTRLAAISSGYQYYKFTSLKFTLLPTADTTTASNVIAFAYIPNESGVTSSNEITEAETVRYHACQATVPTTLFVPKRILNTGVTKMFPVSASATVGEPVQGKLSVSPQASCTATVRFAIQGVCELFAPTVLSLDLMIDNLRAIKAHRDSVVAHHIPPSVEELSRMKLLFEQRYAGK